ncbi:transmembrane protein, putative (macronuclear) [Tetrahymena thermophila SB210]|uniref:Transmembrane protein, putative n=1 Tax=Tetrahymena thermophila (strain SB210) TaxID=312017 RepID=Q22WR2_TETTS|nr:transmembrane protein, putative [Tetrahymena thermophila SB210]EAR89730.1 transmembrane protein, putative [Tetrahymena thermophila SB210]|eukprot:XP_001009975.1 transmembrane protein, putative [Tetrahymena thermophila SB210]
MVHQGNQELQFKSNGENKDETILSASQYSENSFHLNEQNNQLDDTILTVQQMYFDAVDKYKNIKGHIYILYMLLILILITVYSATNEQNSDSDMKQVNLNINVAEDFQSYLESNQEEFQFNFTSIFIEYQKIQFENTQSSSIRYYISLFDKYVFGQVQDGQVINQYEEMILNQCIQDHEQMKQEIIDNIDALKKMKVQNDLEEIIVLKQEIEEMKQYLIFRNSTLNFMNFIQNKTTNYYDYYQYTFEKVNILSNQIDKLDFDIVRNELDIVNRNIIIVEQRSIEEENQILKECMKEIITKNTQKLSKTDKDLLFEKYIYEENELRLKVLEKRIYLQNRKSKLISSLQNYKNTYQEGVKDLINNLIESYFKCIRQD